MQDLLIYVIYAILIGTVLYCISPKGTSFKQCLSLGAIVSFGTVLILSQFVWNI